MNKVVTTHYPKAVNPNNNIWQMEIKEVNPQIDLLIKAGAAEV